jgi:hypothetical protein
MNQALILAMFSLISREVEESSEVEKKMFGEVFKDEDTFFEWTVNELNKADEIEEQFRDVRGKSKRKLSMLDEDEEEEEDDLEQKVNKICDLFEIE